MKKRPNEDWEKIQEDAKRGDRNVNDYWKKTRNLNKKGSVKCQKLMKC